MPARSRKQQMAAGIALAAKRGKRAPESLRGASRVMYETMSERQLDELASTTFSRGRQRGSGDRGER